MRWTAGTSVVPIFAAAALGAAAVWSLVVQPAPFPTLDHHLGNAVEVEGRVVRDPDLRESKIFLTVRPDFVNGEASPATHILVHADRFVDVAYGDRIRVHGVLKVPESFETETGRVFNYPMYLRAQGVSHELVQSEIAILARGEGNPFIAPLIAAKHFLIHGIDQSLTEPESALLKGLLLGEKQSLGEETSDHLRNAGLVHIIVLSGYNVSLVIISVSFIALRLFPRTVAYLGVAAFVIAFAVMTGASETTIRATVMALLMLLAKVLHRPGDALRGLLIAGAVMALANPLVVLYDLSFQLSMLATLGLILFSDSIERRLEWIPSTLGVREIVATTLATQFAVLPLLIFSIGAVSLVFLPANILVLPAVPLAMLLGFIAGVFGGMSPLLAFFPGAMSHAVLSYILIVAEWFGSLPFAAIEIPKALLPPTLLALLLVYALVFSWRISGASALRRKSFSENRSV